ncbi:MAG: hypothetical protein SFY92_05450 [Verrucomicrobiae bacterium]|nr:hypothetical protein [Verrucomicrobiae bacterium]
MANETPLQNASDEELIHRIQARDKNAFFNLCQRYGQNIYNFCFKLSGDHIHAESLFEKVLMKIWDKASDYDTAKVAPMHWIGNMIRAEYTQYTAKFPSNVAAPPPGGIELMDSPATKNFPPTVLARVASKLVSVPSHQTKVEAAPKLPPAPNLPPPLPPMQNMTPVPPRHSGVHKSPFAPSQPPKPAAESKPPTESSEKITLPLPPAIPKIHIKRPAGESVSPPPPVPSTPAANAPVIPTEVFREKPKAPAATAPSPAPTVPVPAPAFPKVDPNKVLTAPAASTQKSPPPPPTKNLPPLPKIQVKDSSSAIPAPSQLSPVTPPAPAAPPPVVPPIAPQAPNAGAKPPAIPAAPPAAPLPGTPSAPLIPKIDPARVAKVSESSVGKITDPEPADQGAAAGKLPTLPKVQVRKPSESSASDKVTALPPVPAPPKIPAPPETVTSTAASPLPKVDPAKTPESAAGKITVPLPPIPPAAKEGAPPVVPVPAPPKVPVAPPPAPATPVIPPAMAAKESALQTQQVPAPPKIPAPPVEPAPPVSHKTDIKAAVPIPPVAAQPPKPVTPPSAPEPLEASSAHEARQVVEKVLHEPAHKISKEEIQEVSNILKKDKKKPAKAERSTPASTHTSSSWWDLKVIAAWGFALIFGCGFFYLSSRYDASSKELGELKVENARLSGDLKLAEDRKITAESDASKIKGTYEELQQKIVDLETARDTLLMEKSKLAEEIRQKDEKIAFLEGSTGKVVFLTSTRTDITAFARVIWDPVAKTGVIYLRNMPNPKPEMKWKVWAMAGGQPVEAGQSTTNAEGSGTTTIKIDPASGEIQRFFVTEIKDGPSGGDSEEIITGVVN